MSFCSKLSTGFPSHSKRKLKSLPLFATLQLKVSSADQQHQLKPNSMGELLNQNLQSTKSLRWYKCPSKFEKQPWWLLLFPFQFSPSHSTSATEAWPPCSSSTCQTPSCSRNFTFGIQSAQKSLFPSYLQGSPLHLLQSFPSVVILVSHPLTTLP